MVNPGGAKVEEEVPLVRSEMLTEEAAAVSVVETTVDSIVGVLIDELIAELVTGFVEVTVDEKVDWLVGGVADEMVDGPVTGFAEEIVDSLVGIVVDESIAVPVADFAEEVVDELVKLLVELSITVLEVRAGLLIVADSVFETLAVIVVTPMLAEVVEEVAVEGLIVDEIELLGSLMAVELTV